MTLALCVVLCCLSVVAATPQLEPSNQTPRSVNLAVETILKFDENDRTPSLKIIRNMQNLFKKLSRALTVEPQFRSRQKLSYHNNANSKLKGDLQDTINTLVKLDDMDLEKVVALGVRELNNCKTCLALLHEVTGDNIYRRSLTFIDKKVKGAPPQEIRDTLLDVKDYLNQDYYSEREEELIKFLESLYDEQVMTMLNKFTLDLDNYKRGKTRRTEDTEPILKKDLKKILGLITNLRSDMRRSIKMKLDAFWGSDVEDDIFSKGSQTRNTDEIQENYKSHRELLGSHERENTETQMKEMARDIQGKLSENLKKSIEPDISNFKIPMRLLNKLSIESGKEYSASVEEYPQKKSTYKKNRFELIKNSHEVQTLYPAERTPKVFRKGKTTPKVNRVEHSFGATINIASLRELLFQMPEKPKKAIPVEQRKRVEDSSGESGLSIEFKYNSNKKSQRRMLNNTENENSFVFKTHFNKSINIEFSTQPPPVNQESAVEKKYNITSFETKDNKTSVVTHDIASSKSYRVSEDTAIKLPEPTKSAQVNAEIKPNVAEPIDIPNKEYKIGVQFD